MFGFGLRGRVTKEVTKGMIPFIRIYEITDGDVPKGFWDDHYVLGYLGMTALLLIKIGSQFKIEGRDTGMAMIDTFAVLTKTDGLAIAKQIAALNQQPTPAFAAGTDAAEKVVTVMYGKKDFDADPAVIKAREAIRKIGNAFGDGDQPEHSRVARQLMTTLFHEVVRDRLIPVRNN